MTSAPRLTGLARRVTRRVGSAARAAVHRLAPDLADRLRTTSSTGQAAPGSGPSQGGPEPAATTTTATTTTTKAPVAVSGMVEQFSRRLVVGWLSVPAGSPPTRVTLHLGGLRIASTWATVGSSMSGVTSVLRSGPTMGGPASEASSPQMRGEVVHSWQLPNVASPADDRRNSSEELRTFSFRVREIWPYVRRSTRITIRVDGRPLPIYGHGMYLSPPRNGQLSKEILKERLAEGYVFSQYGRLQLSKQLDTQWQTSVMALYTRTAAIMRERFGYDLFLAYGTLLGAVREGGYIGHDIDFDAAYVSRKTDPRDAAAELVELALVLVAEGLGVDPRYSCLHVYDPSDPENRIDVFHTYFDDEGVMRFPFGVAGTSRVTRDEWHGTVEIEHPGGRALVPVNAEQMVAHVYGEDWRRPKPGFNWNLDRTDKAVEGELTEDQRTAIYWADFYARTEYTEPSSFLTWVSARPDTPETVVDIGCGDGRDACAFGVQGRRVLGLDQSPVAVEHARSHARHFEVEHRVRVEECDVTDVDRLAGLVADVRSGPEGPVLFYMRFFLHSITEEAQAGLLSVLSDAARPGDVLAVEFRTDKDQDETKVHGGHYRRFQSAETFLASLADRYGFTVVHAEEGQGLSPYREEDPWLCRVVARR